MDKDISQITTYQSGVLQSSAHRALGRVKSDYLSQYGLTAMQWFAIGFVNDAGKKGIRLNDLMRLLDTTMPFITALINGLEAKDIIYKVSDTKDSRVKIAILNPSYRSTVTTIEEGLRDELRLRLYNEGNISRAELQAYISVLYKITKSK